MSAFKNRRASRERHLSENGPFLIECGPLEIDEHGIATLPFCIKTRTSKPRKHFKLTGLTEIIPEVICDP
jgi:hypothetical protein